MKNILECYSIILKNNEELLNRRIIQLKERDSQITQKQFLLDKIKYTFNTFKEDGINYLRLSGMQTQNKNSNNLKDDTINNLNNNIKNDYDEKNFSLKNGENKYKFLINF
jgi:hypothetical protein